MWSETVRIATFNTELERKGPGLLLRDITRGKDRQVQAVIQEILQAQPDVLVLQRFDWDLEGLAMAALQSALDEGGWPLPYGYAPRPNSGVATGQDVNQNRRLGDPQDAQGFGRFSGQRGLLILSRFPILQDQILEWTQKQLWADLPNTRSLDPPDLAAIQRLSSIAHVQVPVKVNGTTIRLLTFHATTPVFDGPEDRNGRRNADEISFARSLLPPLKTEIYDQKVILLGVLNVDPMDGEGLREVVQDLLGDPRLQDPRPTSAGGQAHANPCHQGDPALDTVDWPEPNPGNLRVSYILPSKAFRVVDAGVQWTKDQENTASRHRLVWVDVEVP